MFSNRAAPWSHRYDERDSYANCSTLRKLFYVTQIVLRYGDCSATMQLSRQHIKHKYVRSNSPRVITSAVQKHEEET